MIARVSWVPHEVLSPNDAVLAVARGTIVLSAPLHDLSLQQQPQVVQVWLEPRAPVPPQDTNVRLPLAIQTLPLITQLDASNIVFRTLADRAQLTEILGQGGRVLIRVHCGHLLDEAERPFSASLDGVLGTKSPHTPGGVHETWFFVKGG